MQLQPIRFKKCGKCGIEADEEAAFRRDASKSRRSASAHAEQFRAVCVGCELTERNDPTPEERARRKARNSLVGHAEKYEMQPAEFAKRYGWDIERMSYDILHVHANTCTYCWEKYEHMGHGLSDVTLDIVDRQREPYYRTNVKWCCQTCNREKASMTPELWARRLEFWPQYMKHREAIKGNVTHGLPLFQQRTLFSIAALAATFWNALTTRFF